MPIWCKINWKNIYNKQNIKRIVQKLYRDNKYRFICSESELGILLENKDGLSPMGSTIEKKMYPMDFEEFLLANGCDDDTINYLKDCFNKKETINDSMNEYILNLFKSYLYVGGLPECVKMFVEEKNIYKIKEIQKLTYNYYINDATKYDKNKKLKTRAVYNSMLSYMQNKEKRLQISKINNKKEKISKYIDEFDYLIYSGIVLSSKAIADPKFPLVQTTDKNLIKFYYNDVGILSYMLYKNNINAIINDDSKIYLGSIYETAVAQELAAHDHTLYYYNKKSWRSRFFDKRF